ncbi:MAG TPA: hypothetical protein VMO76_18250 [Candidatus Udaeobacter sp.]|nr:hypothetical protein [Candidatus Udaeobacter sp.]
MHHHTSRIAVLALLLAVVFLGAQFHFCTELTAGPAATHVCPVCSAATSAMVSEALLLTVASVSDRLESPGARLALSIDIPQGISPRAPPTSGRVS